MNVSSPVYRSSCPSCHAPAGRPCRTKRGQHARFPHSVRGRDAAPSMPDLSAWWKEMRKFEGQHPKARPEGLEV